MFVRPANGDNAKLRATLEPLLLGERLKWNPDKVAFGVRVYTKKQAAQMLAALRSDAGAGAADLPDAVADEPWTDDTNAAVAIVQCKRIHDENTDGQFADDSAAVTEEDVILLDGVTYPLKENLKEMGFQWTGDFNNIEGAVRAAMLPCPAPRAPHAGPRPAPPAHTAGRCRAGLHDGRVPVCAEPLGALGQRL